MTPRPRPQRMPTLPQRRRPRRRRRRARICRQSGPCPRRPRRRRPMIDKWLPWLRLEVPLRRDASARFLPWIIALMVYLAATGGAAMVLLVDTVADWDRSLTTTLTLQVPADASPARLDITV